MDFSTLSQAPLSFFKGASKVALEIAIFQIG